MNRKCFKSMMSLLKNLSYQEVKSFGFPADLWGFYNLEFDDSNVSY